MLANFSVTPPWLEPKNIKSFCGAQCFRRKLAQIALASLQFSQKATRRRHRIPLVSPILKSNYRRIDRKSLFGEIFLVFGHNVTLCALAVVEVTRLPKDLKTKLGKRLKREVKKPNVVGLENEKTTLFEKKASRYNDIRVNGIR